ncbi:MAG TPA: GntR family transcriptional regulator [Hyphomonadaceae bacterium]|nr:GntR family transcriptional regulator [Hyphomonadaceae bacterium]
MEETSMMISTPDGQSSSPRQSDHALACIKNEIVSCRLAPGAHFSEAELSNRYGLARAATRAALTRLTDVGLVQPVPRHGFIITPITVASLRELFELRLMIEPQAAALAVGRLDPAHLRAINAAPQNAKSKTEQLAFVDSNRAFHSEIARSSGNRRLFALLETLADEMQRLVHLGLFGPGGSVHEQREADAQHEALIAAFEAGDAQAVQQASRLHIEHSRALAMDRIVKGLAPLVLA